MFDLIETQVSDHRDWKRWEIWSASLPGNGGKTQPIKVKRNAWHSSKQTDLTDRKDWEIQRNRRSKTPWSQFKISKIGFGVPISLVICLIRTKKCATLSPCFPNCVVSWMCRSGLPQDCDTVINTPGNNGERLSFQLSVMSLLSVFKLWINSRASSEAVFSASSWMLMSSLLTCRHNVYHLHHLSL